jgi:hypothetical protein
MGGVATDNVIENLIASSRRAALLGMTSARRFERFATRGFTRWSRPRFASTSPVMTCRRATPTNPSIAESLGLSVSAVRHAIRHNVLPAWKEDLVVDAVATLTRLRHTADIAWRDWRADPTSAAASRMYRWAIDREISITGQSVPQRIEVDHTEYRVAGSCKIELEQKMLKRLADKMQEIRALSRDAQVIDVPQVPLNGE